MKRYVCSLCVILLACCTSAMAQSEYVGSEGYAAGGYTVVTGEAANFVDNGWNVGGGMQWQPGSGPIWLRLDFEYSRNDATQQLLGEGAAANQTRIDHGWSDLWSNDLDAVYYLPISHRIHAYVMAGGGGAIRRISLTQTLSSSGPACVDWAGLCGNGGYPGDVVVESKTTGRWEWNAGVGLNFSLGGTDSFFVEARYMEVETPVPTVFIPIRFGLLL